jgi:hypothetical protein
MHRPCFQRPIYQKMSRDINDCKVNAPDGPSTAEIAALYEDDCGSVNVSRAMSMTGDDCAWTVTYEFTITDDCGNEVFA